MTVSTRRRLSPAAALAALLLLARGASAQLPAPPASAREPLRLGGYGSLVYGHSSLDAAPATDDVSEAAAALLASGSFGGRLSYFAEIEAASRTTENWTGRRADRAPQLDRLYAEYAFADALRVRVGRFLTPVGQWNEIHADPLTWTALRPLTTYRPFAKSTTGLMLAGQTALAGHDVGYAAWGAPVRLRGDREETSFVTAAGGRIAIELLPGLYLGASGATYRASRPVDGESETPGGGETEALVGAAPARALADGVDPGTGAGVEPADREEDATPRALIGGDLSWAYGRAELLAEATYVSASGVEPGEGGAFAQAALRVLGPLRAVVRAERYQPVVTGPLDVFTVGGAVRLPHLTLKLDRQIPSRANPRVSDGWFVSVSAIF